MFDRTLSPYASHPADSRGRRHNSGAGGVRTRGPRDDFQRDRDRVIHSAGFRRLRHKTQVFISPDGDHDRVRLTHSLEVAQIGRTIARALGLNEDLTEAICLAHDIGHPPFGHAGENALQHAMRDYGGFDHNGQTLRTVMQLESPYPYFSGLNLTWETLEGLAKHNGPVADPQWALADADAEIPLDLDSYASLEAQVAAVSDDIAYDNHDIDDGLRAGLLSVEQLRTQPMLADAWNGLAASNSGVSDELLARELVRTQIGVMVNDVIVTTRSAIAAHGIETADDARGAGRTIAGFSPDMEVQERELKRFMYANLYHHRQQVEGAEAAETVIGALFAAFADNPAAMDGEWTASLPDDQPARARHISDYIAGMTDRFACTKFIEFHGAGALPLALR